MPVSEWYGIFFLLCFATRIVLKPVSFPFLAVCLPSVQTLLEEAGIPAPSCPASQAASRATMFCTEGRSLSALLRAPADPPASAGSFAASYSQFPRPEHPSRMVDLDCRPRI